LAVGGLGLAATPLVDGEHYVVGEVQVEGIRHAGLTEIRHLANIPARTKLWEVDTHATAASVIAHPWVRSATATRNWPNGVTIHVEEYQPVLLVQQRGLFYADAAGTVFKRARTDDLDYPVLTGIDAQWADLYPAVAQRIVRDALKVLHGVAADSLLSTSAVSEIRFSEVSGFSIALRNGTELVLGFGDPTAPLSRFHRMLQSGLDLSKGPYRMDLTAPAMAVLTPLATLADARSAVATP
jgi:cell division protein FtsQ